jgi:hypothetical protein
MRGDFPHLPSSNRFVELMPGLAMPLAAYVHARRGQCTGLSFIDATDLAVCHNRRISQHRVFRGLAARGKTSVDWFYGFKLHLVINDGGELLGVRLTPGNVDDRRPVPQLARNLWGQLVGDRGYISQELSQLLWGAGRATGDEDQTEHEEQVNAAVGEVDAEKTGDYRECDRSVEEHLAD